MPRSLLLFLLLLPGLASARGEVPDTPAGRAFSAWLLAFNQSDRAGLEAFGRTWGELQPVDDTLGFRDFTGGYTLESIAQSQPLELVAMVRERDGQMAPTRLTLRLGPGDPPRLTALDFEPQDIARLDTAQVLAGLSTRAQALADEDRFSGAFLVARHDRVLLKQAFGLANRATGEAATLDTRFRYGSAGKMFTAVAVLQQVEAGKIALDGKVDDYLPGYPNRALATTVTIRHLLTHTGGTGGIDVFGPGFAENRRSLRSHADYLEHHAARAADFPAGSKVDYSNYGFVLLGAILENVTGQDYYTLLQEKVFAPAGMDRTGMEPESTAVAGRAVAYRRQDGTWVDAADTLPWRGMAAGGGYTTVGDLLKFARALQGGKLLGKAMLEQATSPQIDEQWYGFGFITVGKGGLRRFGHGGDADGMNADFRVFPESGWVLVSLSNLDPPAAYRLTRWFEPRMPLDEPAPPAAEP